MSDITEISWPDTLVAKPNMTYDSICLLYDDTKPEVFGDHMAFIVACSDPEDESKGFLHKLEISTTTEFASAKIAVTHEVLPGLARCNSIKRVNDDLLVACFHSGCIIPIKNFGAKKTFNSDVRGKLKHHENPIKFLSVKPDGTWFACLTEDGELGIYSVEQDKISFCSKRRPFNGYIIDLPGGGDYYELEKAHRSATGLDMSGLDSTIYLTNQSMGLFLQYRECSKKMCREDIRQFRGSKEKCSAMCGFAIHKDEEYYHHLFMGTQDGAIYEIDLLDQDYLDPHQFNFNEELGKPIGCIKPIRIKFGDKQILTFVAFTDGTEMIKIFPVIRVMHNPGWWICERAPKHVQKDIIQVGNRIITCGEQASIGIWTWKVNEEALSRAR